MEKIIPKWMFDRIKKKFPHITTMEQIHSLTDKQLLSISLFGTKRLHRLRTLNGEQRNTLNTTIMKKLILSTVIWSTSGQKYEEPRLVSVNCTPDDPEDDLLKKANGIIERTFIHEYGNECVFLGAVSKRTISDSAYNQPEQLNVHGFCENPETKCNTNYCDDNGCQERERNLVDIPNDPI